MARPLRTSGAIRPHDLRLAGFRAYLDGAASPQREARRSPASVQVQPYPLCAPDAYADPIVPSQIPRNLPTSDIRRSARRSAATDGGTPSESAIASTLAVVTKICSQAARARSKLKPASSSATWMTPPELTT